MGLDVKVAYHGVRLPSTKELDFGPINLFVEQSHGTGGLQGLDGYVLGGDSTRRVAQEEAFLAEEGGDDMGRKLRGSRKHPSEVGGEGCVIGGIIGAEV